MSDATEPGDVTDAVQATGTAETAETGTDTADRSDPAPPSAAASAAQERAREGFEHLQSAAHELIAAARAALDVAEDLIDDPETVSSVVGAAGHLGGLGDLLRNLLPTRRDTAGGGGRAGTDPDED